MQIAVDRSQIYEALADLPRFGSEFVSEDIPANGLYIFYERGETIQYGGGHAPRVVRVGTHLGDDRLPKRLAIHFHGRARRSVFRRHVGAAMERARRSPVIPCSSTGLDSVLFSDDLEREISRRFADYFTFSVVRVDCKEDRLRLEAGLIGALSAEPHTEPSAGWLGHHSCVDAIRSSGLWNRQHVGGPVLSTNDLGLLLQRV